MNVIATWLYLIGTAANAKKLRKRLEYGLTPPPLDPLFGKEPPQCPLTVLYGAELSRRAYTNDSIRPALDAWDNGEVDSNDLIRYCVEIEKNRYNGPVFTTDSLIYGALPIRRVYLADPWAIVQTRTQTPSRRRAPAS